MIFTKYIFADDADNIYSQLDKTQAFDDEVDARNKIWTSRLRSIYLPVSIPFF